MVLKKRKVHMIEATYDEDEGVLIRQYEKEEPFFDESNYTKTWNAVKKCPFHIGSVVVMPLAAYRNMGAPAWLMFIWGALFTCVLFYTITIFQDEFDPK